MSPSVARTRRVLLAAGALLLWPVAASALELTSELRATIEAGQRASALSRLERAATGPGRDHANRLQLTLLSPRPARDLLQGAAKAQERQAFDRVRTQHALAEGAAPQALRYAARLADSATTPDAHSQAQYLLAQAEWVAGLTSEAERRFDWLSRHGDTPWREWGLFGQAHAALERHDTVEAVRLFRATAAQGHHEAVAPALLLLGQIHDERGEAAQAIRYLTMYREAYPRGAMPVLEHGLSGSDAADAAAGVRYTIQVGVFGERANAERQRDRFTALGYEVTFQPKTVAGRRYTAVWVGRFAARDEAARLRRRLEAQFGETYRVVVRE